MDKEEVAALGRGRRVTDSGRSGMRGFNKVTGGERERYGEFIIDRRRCGAKPGFYCRKPSGQITYDSHKDQRARAKVQAKV